MKKVALLHFASPPNPGGVEKLLQNQANILKRLGFGVKILTGSQIPVLGSIKNFDPKLQDKILNKNKIDQDFYNLSSKILEVLSENLRDCDVVIVHNMLTVYRNLAFIYAFRQYTDKNPTKKYINWIHDHMLIEGDRIKRDPNLSKFALDLLTEPIKSVMYVTISQTLADLLKKIIKLKIEVISDGLDLKEEFGLSDCIWKFVQKYSLLSKNPLFLCPANIVERKNIEYSIEIVARLKRIFPRICLIVTGDTSKHKNTKDYFKDLKSLVKKREVKDNVIFLAEIFEKPRTDRDIRGLYMLCDAVLYFSKSENFGLPVIEASLFRIPIFLSNLKAFKEIAGENLRYFEINSERSLIESSNHIKNFVENDESFKLRNRVKSKYNLEDILRKKLLPIL